MIFFFMFVSWFIFLVRAHSNEIYLFIMARTSNARNCCVVFIFVVFHSVLSRSCVSFARTFLCWIRPIHGITSRHESVLLVCISLRRCGCVYCVQYYCHFFGTRLSSCVRTGARETRFALKYSSAEHSDLFVNVFFFFLSFIAQKCCCPGYHRRCTQFLWEKCIFFPLVRVKKRAK